MALKKKKDESTNDKIVRLFQEGKTVDEICAEIELRNDIVVGVIRRKLGPDSIPETVITAKPKNIQSAENESPAADEEVDTEGMTKLERYMLEKKKKQEEEESAPSEGRVSLVEDYMRQNNIKNEPVSAPNTAEMESISLDSISAEPLMPEEPVPAAVEISEMDSVSTTELNAADSVVENNFEAADVSAAPAENSDASASAENSSKAVNKMKAFAMSQIEANNAKISGLEEKAVKLEAEYAPQIEAANNALTESQNNYEAVEAKFSEAYANNEKAREEHRAALAKAEDDYRRKLEEIDAEYKQATSAANEKLQAYEETSKAVLDNLDSEKSAAQADLLAKQNTVNDLRAKMTSESEAIAVQIKGLKDENDGYQDFLV